MSRRFSKLAALVLVAWQAGAAAQPDPVPLDWLSVPEPSELEAAESLLAPGMQRLRQALFAEKTIPEKSDAWQKRVEERKEVWEARAKAEIEAKNARTEEQMREDTTGEGCSGMVFSPNRAWRISLLPSFINAMSSSATSA